MMSFSDAVTSAFQQYVTFSGRTPRSGYWYWVLFIFVLSFFAGLIDQAIMGQEAVMEMNGMGYVNLLLTIVTFLPYLSVLVRRLHDINRSGWWFWIVVIPILGIIVLIVFLCMKGTDGDNRFGPDPLAAE